MALIPVIDDMPAVTASLRMLLLLTGIGATPQLL